MTIAYIDCFSGISGDMFVGALLDLGLPFNELKKAIESLPFDGYSIDYKTEMKNGLKGTRFIVSLDSRQDHHDSHHHHEHHDHHEHHSGHVHDSPHEHDVHTVEQTPHEHRGLPDIEKIINAGALNDKVKQRSLSMFRSIAEVEGAIHNHPPE
ncbi:MAG: LarC family nickel insertion protein, partial [Deltaproteobacteria bacterium]|nr:LarC family nickel insertion protein [Deltaproteobacteria bacterium]